MKLTNDRENEKGYGLTLDHNLKPDVASIASTGFVLSSYIIADTYGYLPRKEIVKRVKKTLETLWYNVPHFKGFFVHFVDIHTASRYKKSEYSTVDTLLCIKGVIAVSSYFDDLEIKHLADKILNRIEWDFFIDHRSDKKRFYTAYNPDKDGDYANGEAGFIYYWHMLAEQIVMYIIAAGSKRLSNETALELYEGFERNLGSYQGHKYYYSPGNTLFVYQYPLCWLDGKNWINKDGFSWYQNLKNATLGHRAWNLRNYKRFKTFSRETFGLTASSSPNGYSVFHCVPSISNSYLTDGTIQPNAMIGSLITNPKEVLKALFYMKDIPKVWTKYGFVDAYNFEDRKWISKQFITIDNGLEMLMANAYLSGEVVASFMNHEIIKRGLEVLQWKKI
ncbi:glucoamylase family protein [Acholeplasma hippikon]|nr:glucoamylase family protein [Acholeplasma hippikon]